MTPEVHEEIKEYKREINELRAVLRNIIEQIDNGTPFRYYDVTHTLVHIPSKILNECLITTENELVTYSEQVLAKVAEVK